MKIKNIMFSGVMASILMVGGAYAADPDNRLATAEFVKGGVQSAKDYADTQIQAAVNELDATVSQTGVNSGDGVNGGLSLSITETDGKITAISGSVNANAFDAKGAAAAVQGDTTTTVKANEDAIAILNGNATTEGSVAKSIADALLDAGLDDTLGDRLTAAEDKIGMTTTLSAGAADSVVQAVNANYSAIATLNGADTVAGSVAKAEKDAKAYTDTEIGKLDVASLSISGSGVAVSLSETDGKIGNLTASIETGGVKTANIADGAVTADQIGAAAVTTAKIADGNVTEAKLDSAVQASLANADSAIQATDLATASAVGVVKVDDVTIGANSGTISVKDGSITYAKIATDDLATEWGK